MRGNSLKKATREFPVGKKLFISAMALLFLAGGYAALQGQNFENRVVLDIESTASNPRNSEGAFVELRDGRLMFAYTRFYGGSADSAGADIAAVYSSDSGATWTKRPEIIVKNDAVENVMSVSLLRLLDGRIALFYLKKNGLDDCRLWMRTSADEGKTWSAPLLAIPAPGYFVVNNDRVIQLRSGRLVVPAAFHRMKGEDARDFRNFDYRAIALSFLSDDGGQTWRESESWWGIPEPSKSGLQEPGAIELRDGTLLSWMRTDRGCQYAMSSSDGANTWTPPQPSLFKSPNSPLSMKRIPARGDLLAVWNDHSGRFPFPDKTEHFMGRTPLVSAISRDDGKTWEHFQQVENAPNGGYCYTAIYFKDEWVLLAYWAGEALGDKVVTRLRIRRISLDWFYK
jgi:Neuraminidase (sialidase)